MRPLAARLFALALLALAGLAAGPAVLTAPAWAQEGEEVVDYGDWVAVAERAEDATAAGEASDQAFQALRAEIVEWREQFLAAQSVNAARIRTLQAQIAALGPAPAEGESEAEDVAARRAELNAQLSEVQAPVRRAEEAFSRADALVAEIDRILRERTADALLKLGPTPLNPALWPEAVAKLTASIGEIWNEVDVAWDSPAQRGRLQENLPLVLLYLAIAALLLARGRSVMERMTGVVLERSKGRARAVAGFLASLLQIIVPALGIALLVEALQSTGLLGPRGQAVTDALPLFGLVIFGTRWLVLRLFPTRSDVAQLMPTSAEQSRYMRYYGISAGLLIGLAVLLRALVVYENYDETVQAVLFFPILALLGFLLFRIGRILTRSARDARAEAAEGEPTFGARSLGLVGNLTVALSIVGTALAAIGYLNAGVFMLLPTANSLMLLGLLLVLNDLIREIYALLTRSDVEQAREALTPTLLGLLLALVSLPVFALIWGARVSDLTEAWASFQAGFDVGGTQISPSIFLTFAVVFTALFIATRLMQSALRTVVLPKTRIDPGGQNAIIAGLGYVGIFLAAIIGITAAGIDLSSLAIVAGALSIGIGFGLQNIVSNFVSGIILLIERPISQGDWIEVGGNTGIVKAISVRSTRIETFDRVDIIVPNADFVSGAVKNWTRGNVIGRVIVPVGVAYGTDTRKVEAILKEIAMEHPLVTMNPEPGVDFLEFGADSLNFRIRAVIRDVNYSVPVKSELNHRIAERFAEEGIEIPFAQRDIWLRNPEALPGAKAAEEKPPAAAEDTPPTASETLEGAAPPPGADVRNVPSEDDEDGDGDGEGDAR